jgi:hypothetical protein
MESLSPFLWDAFIPYSLSVVPALILVNADIVTNGSDAYDVKIQGCII